MTMFGHCTVIVWLAVIGASFDASAVAVFGSVPPTHSAPLGWVPFTTWTEKPAPGARSTGPQCRTCVGTAPVTVQPEMLVWPATDQLMPSPAGSGSFRV